MKWGLTTLSLALLLASASLVSGARRVQFTSKSMNTKASNNNYNLKLDNFEDELLNNNKNKNSLTKSHCTQFTECSSCKSVDGCGWCDSTSQCQSGDDSSSYDHCPSSAWYKGYCPNGCSNYKSCSFCTSIMNCGWCFDSSANSTANYTAMTSTTSSQGGKCISGYSFGPQYATSCPAQHFSYYTCAAPTLSCDDRTSCSACTQSSTCAWCQSSQKCIPSTQDGVVNAQLDCPGYNYYHQYCPPDTPSASACSVHTSCKTCGKTSGCGWCASSNQCIPGSYSGPTAQITGNSTSESGNRTDSASMCAPNQFYYSYCPYNYDVCQFMSYCDMCLSATQYNCGWCNATNSCYSMSSEDSYCPSSDQPPVTFSQCQTQHNDHNGGCQSSTCSDIVRSCPSTTRMGGKWCWDYASSDIYCCGSDCCTLKPLPLVGVLLGHVASIAAITATTAGLFV